MTTTLKPRPPRMQVIGIRLSRAERLAVRRAARARGVTMSAFIRDVALAALPEAKAEGEQAA